MGDYLKPESAGQESTSAVLPGTPPLLRSESFAGQETHTPGSRLQERDRSCLWGLSFSALARACRGGILQSG